MEDRALVRVVQGQAPRGDVQRVLGVPDGRDGMRLDRVVMLGGVVYAWSTVTGAWARAASTSPSCVSVFLKALTRRGRYACG